MSDAVDDGTFLQDVLRRLPLAESMLHLWRWAATEEVLQEVFNRSRERSYERDISFETLTSLMLRALIDHKGSARRAMEESKDNGFLGATIQATYGKLRRMPEPLSLDLANVLLERLHQVYPDSTRDARDADKASNSLGDVGLDIEVDDVLILDGKAMKNIPRRLKKARGVKASLLGGRALVALSQRTGLIKAVQTHLDGHINEVRLFPDLMETLRGQEHDQTSPPPSPHRRCLWVGDRAFCTQDIVHHFESHGDVWLIRYHRNLQYLRDETVPSRDSQDVQGRACTESWGWLGTVKNPHRFRVRAIELHHPNITSRNRGSTTLILMTNLTDPERCPAVNLLEMYRDRWRIEQVFQQLTEVFGLSHIIGSSPQATIFQFVFCVLLYNMIHIQKAYIARAQRRDPHTVSSKKFFDDVRAQLTTLATLAVVSADDSCLVLPAEGSAAEVRRQLNDLLVGQWRPRWSKAPPRPNRPPKPRNGPQPGQPYGQHESLYRILNQDTTKPERNEKQ